MRLVACALALAVVAGVANAAGAPAPKKEEADGVQSAAVAGRFETLPPSDRAYPTDILVRMRDRLVGEAEAQGADPAEAEADGH